MNYHITNVIYVISSNSLEQMQTRMEWIFTTIQRLFYKKVANKRKSNDFTFKWYDFLRK